MSYHIKLVVGSWHLLRHGAIIGTFITRIEARAAIKVERERRGE
jgi:hypothetical protein